MVVNLQKSQYGEQFYINFGNALKALNPPELPKEYQCHVRFRVEATIPESERDLCKAALNLENVAVTSDARMATIRRLMEKYSLPLLKDCSSSAGIAKANANGRLRHAMVHRHVKDLLA